MARVFSATAVNSQNDEESDQVWLVLVTLNHPSLTQPIYIANNTENVISQGITYLPIPCDIELPTEDGDNPGAASIKVDNIDPVIVNTIRNASNARDPSQATPPYISVNFKVILASNTNQVELEFDGLRIIDTDWDATSVTGKLAFENIQTEPVAETITPSRFSGLF